jgi:hypothetical protein
MLQFAGNDQEMSTILTSMAMMNMEGEGLKDTRDFFRKRLVRMGAVDPTEDEMQEMEAELAAADQKPDANEVLLLAAAKKDESTAALNEAKLAQTAADTTLKQAQAAKLGADIDSTRKSDVISILDVIREPEPVKTPSGAKQ